MQIRLRQSLVKSLFIILTGLSLTSCETVQTTQSGVVSVDRKQMMAVSSQDIDAASSQTYAKLIAEERSKGTLNRDSSQVSRVRAIANRLIAQTPAFRPEARNWDWEVNVITSPEVNAWCMPGGKIAVYTGLIQSLQASDDELAAVIGHEMAHALREHARERASEQAVAGAGISILAAVTGVGDVAQKGMEYAYMGLLGLPNSRRHETEADRIGVELAARAGYDPRATITLWQKMGQVAGGEPIKFLSTHPSREDRMSDLTVYSQRVMPLYEQNRRK
ncbi:peptidase M48-like protein [Paucimonas lemoignei]|uniref:Peptidase M48-like protein n=1 Tax=Paucimonas lemoignei TaxID=29443 RepID=A0A4R3I1J7_PAULE|nr:M48 family metallopeptidase [Paucimonas lemoignei]TCS39626.1 peptidase M48-like protein [Paucimonas lemoignei]